MRTPSSPAVSSEQAYLDTLGALSMNAYLRQTVTRRDESGRTIVLPSNVVGPLVALKHLGRPARPAEIARELRLETPAVFNALSRWLESDGHHFIRRRDDGAFQLTLKGHPLAYELAFQGSLYLAERQAGR